MRFFDETDTHVVLSGLGGGGGRDDEGDEDSHACLVGLVTFVAAHPEVLSVQMRARYGSQNHVASWIIQVRVSHMHEQCVVGMPKPTHHLFTPAAHVSRRAGTSTRIRIRCGSWA